jgi:hypothetical protein
VALHNIIHIHNNVMWDREYFTEYIPHSRILLVPHNDNMDLNNDVYKNIVQKVQTFVMFYLFIDIHRRRQPVGSCMGNHC